jgi:hypothetical protein
MKQSELVAYFEKHSDDLFATPDSRDARPGWWIARGLQTGEVSPAVAEEVRKHWQSAGPGARLSRREVK